MVQCSLSDFCFVAARFAAQHSKESEVIYIRASTIAKPVKSTAVISDATSSVDPGERSTSPAPGV